MTDGGPVWGEGTRLRPIRITTDMTTIKRKNFTKTTAVRRESLVIVIRFELSPGGKGCGFLFKRTGVRLPPAYRLVQDLLAAKRDLSLPATITPTQQLDDFLLLDDLAILAPGWPAGV